MKNSTKFMIVLIILILIAGTIILFTKGLAFGLKYGEAQEIEVNIGDEVQISDIKEVTSEVFGSQPVLVRYIEIYKDTVNITTTSITEEQKDELITKLNEKYEKELSLDDVEITQKSSVKLKDIIKHYIAPFGIVTAIVLVYFMIRYHKLNIFKVLVQAIVIMVLSQWMLLSIMAITRMPVGDFTIPAVIVIYIISTYLCEKKFDGDFLL